MQVRIKNALLNEIVELLFDWKLKGRQSRHRSRFIRLLNERVETVIEEEQELLKEHCYLDEDGEPKIKEINGKKHYDIKDFGAFSKDKADLLNEEMVIEGADNKTMLLTVREVLDECEEELAGREAVLYEHLCEVFKVDEDIDAEDEDE